MAPIYIGEQDLAHKSQDPGNSSNPSTAKDAADGNSSETNYIGLANSAVPLLKQEGFPVGTTVYLDIETSGAQSQPELDYISAWCSAVSAAGYISGIYCLTSAVRIHRDGGTQCAILDCESDRPITRRHAISDNGSFRVGRAKRDSMAV